MIRSHQLKINSPMNMPTGSSSTTAFSNWRSLLYLLICLLLSVHSIAQTATNACGYLPWNQYPVNNYICQYSNFNVLNSFNASMNPGGCSSGNNTDGWGWFIATGNPTVITYEPEASVRAILHILTGT